MWKKKKRNFKSETMSSITFWYPLYYTITVFKSSFDVFRSKRKWVKDTYKIHHLCPYTHWWFTFRCEIENREILTCRLNASGIVNVLDIQQNVLTTCVGIPLTMQLIGCPTYCVAVMTKLQVNSKTVVKTLCNLNTALSVWTSCHLK